MHAFLTEDHRLRPRPAVNGFFVYPEILDSGEGKEIGPAIEESQITAQLYNYHDFDDSSSSQSDEQDQVDDCNSSLGSFGPETPPRLDLPPIQEFTKRDHHSRI